MKVLNLLEYRILGEGVHCTIEILIYGEVAFKLDTQTKYIDTAEESLKKVLEEILKKLFNKLNSESIKLIK